MKILLFSLVLFCAVGCSRPVQRFVPIVVPGYHDDAAGAVSPSVFVLDTKTGQYCNGSPKQSSVFPLCYDLYTGKVK
jgi:hypothetical protein